MRDTTIQQMHQANARRDSLLLGQFEFLQTRQEAMERVVLAASWRDRFLWLVKPAHFFAVADAVQANLLAARRKQMEAAAAKPRIHRPGNA